jgi:lipopolysaccharide biosynthesis regulator YciM
VLDWRLFGLLFVAVALGYFFGRRSVTRDEDDFSASFLEPHYIRGLNYFLNDQPDEAIDTFIGALDVNSETLETHLALGGLLRKRGEVGRAIKVHQNLLARPGLPEIKSHQIQLELARDYISSGLFDRAEVLLQELSIEADDLTRKQSLTYLVEIYRDEKEWLKGIDVINRLSSRRFSRLPEEWRLRLNHFYCELAQTALDNEDNLSCRKYVKHAMAADKNSIRASLILAKLESNQGNYRDAIKYLKQAPFQDPAFLPEVIPVLVSSYKQQGNIKELKAYLEELLRSHHHACVVLALAEIVVKEDGRQAAVEFIVGHIESIPTLATIKQMLTLQLESSAQDKTLAMADLAISNLQLTHPLYRCHSCGFGGKHLHWLCPSCKSWGTVKPAE